MKSFALVCAIVIALSCYIAADYRISNYDYNDLQVNDIQRTECNYEIITKNAKDAECTPRDTLIKLYPPMGYIFYPTYALVKRCDGFCHARARTCIPVETNFAAVTVNMFGIDHKFCYNVSVLEHTKCKCKCKVKEEHCSENQTYSEDDCSCECKHREECKISGMVWNKDLCKCVCIKEEPCPSELVWVPSMCRCAQVVNIPMDLFRKTMRNSLFNIHNINRLNNRIKWNNRNRWNNKNRSN